MISSMETRKTVKKTIPASPEREVEDIVSSFSCDRCGAQLMEHNSRGGFYDQINRDKVPRNMVTVFLSRNHFSGIEEEDERLARDYCDACYATVRKAIHILLEFGK